jgi:hypothetical protein
MANPIGNIYAPFVHPPVAHFSKERFLKAVKEITQESLQQKYPDRSPGFIEETLAAINYYAAMPSFSDDPEYFINALHDKRGLTDIAAGPEEYAGYFLRDLIRDLTTKV